MADSLTGLGASLEAPTMIVSGGASPVMGIIEHVTATRCRMRSVNRFDVGAALEFNLVLHGAPPISLQGTVHSRAQDGPRFHYEIGLNTTLVEAVAIERAVLTARARAEARLPDVPTGNGLTRSSVRVPVDFHVRYALEGGGTFDARATNISTGGILLNAREQLAVGTSLELHFLLDGEAVSVHGRIVAHQAGSPNYNIAFYDVRDLAKEALARFVKQHAGT